MTKNSFVLSWGRKMFFGLGWALTSVVALSYFQSMLFPTTTVGWLYLLTTFVGLYGMALTLIYFLIFCPVVLLFPYYYVSRIWSITLILLLNLFIFFDSYVFVRYRYHLNSFLWDFLKQGEPLSAYGLNSIKLSLIIFSFLILLVFLWMRGESLWRRMGRRFSNPVSNWYLLIIITSFVLSNTMHMLIEAKNVKAIDKLADLFPMHFPLTAKKFITGRGIEGKEIPGLAHGYKDLYYPSEPVNCPKQAQLNVLMIVVDELKYSDYSPEKAPNLYHYGGHGQFFANHFSGGLNPTDGYFSLLYALPPVYEESVMNAQVLPVFVSQLKKSEMDLLFYNSGAQSPLSKYIPDAKEVYTDYLVSQMNERVQSAEGRPFFMHVYLSGGGITEKDLIIKEIMNGFIKNRLIEKTVIMITGASSPELKTPLVVLGPDGVREEIQRMTSHYDVLPTLMTEEWRCKTAPEKYSFGHNLYSKKEREVHVAGNVRQLMIFDIKDESMTTIKDGSEIKVTGAAKVNAERTLNTLNQLIRFHKSI